MKNNILKELLNEISYEFPENTFIENCEEGYEIECNGKGECRIRCDSNLSLAQALLALKTYGTDTARTFSAKCRFEQLGIMVDCSRNAVPTVETVKKLIRIMALLGYRSLQLYTEDTYEIPSQPYFGYLRGRYSSEELKELDAYADELGIELVPCIQTLAHLERIFRWKCYDEVRDFGNILLCDEEKTYELIEAMFSAVRGCFKSKRINIGMDEAHMLGLGRYLDIHGFTDRTQIMIKHLIRVIEIAEKYGFKPIMWSDMFFRLANGGAYYSDKNNVSSETVGELAKRVELIYWDYYSPDRLHYERNMEAHKKLGTKTWFAAGAWKWIGFTPDNAHSINTSGAGIEACLNKEVKNVILTAWGDNGGEASLFSVLPTFAYFAGKAYGFSEEYVHNSFISLTGIQFEDFMHIDNANFIGGAEVGDYNPNKYLFYNDPFLGIFDRRVCEQGKEDIERFLEKYGSLEFGRYNYIFETQKALLRVLSVKYDLGVRTRRYYKLGNKSGLKGLIAEYNELCANINEFYRAFLKQWETENKPFGFETQDIRIGGLLKRAEHCREQLERYLAGETKSISELEETILDSECEENFSDNRICENTWSRMVSPGDMT